MNTNRRITFTRNEAITWSTPNYWDFIALSIVFGIILLFIWGARQMATPYDLGQAMPLSLHPSHLPLYAVRTVLRMFIAMFFALLFTFVFGTWAAKNKRAERIIIPFIDIMQSVPVLSFLSITVVGFITIFRGSMLGPECAAIFAIFTSQVWNMTLSFYQSISTVPKDLREVSSVFGLSTWRCFWRIEVPFAMPGLLWNMMMSMSGSWFFVTASEAFSVANQNITLPGVGSYISLAILSANKMAVLYAIITMFLVILLYDQFLFRPLIQWTEKFNFEQDSGAKSSRSWVVNLFQRTRLLIQFGDIISALFTTFVDLKFLNLKTVHKQPRKIDLTIRRYRAICIDIVFVLILLAAMCALGYFLFYVVDFASVKRALWVGFITGIRVMVLIILCSFIWVPIGVWIGLKPRIAKIAQPIIQFLAAFPANLLFPLFAYFIIRYELNVNVWVSPLAVLGTQWYILFNVVAGASIIPYDLRQATRNLGVRGWIWWKRLILPSIFPYFITGAITAAGGAWNASIVAEVIKWGNIKLQAVGLGAYITNYATIGDFKHIALGTIVMCLFVLTINRLLWRPLYNFAIEKFRLD